MKDKRTALPKAALRTRGKMRVEALLEAAVAEFGARGFGGTTMTAVAAGAQAPVGSLYQFFPSKEALARGVLDRYAAALDDALAALEADPPAPERLGSALIEAVVPLRGLKGAAIRLLDDVGDAEGFRAQVRSLLRARLTGLLAIVAPALDADRVQAVALVLQLVIKSAAAVEAEPAVLNELGRLLSAGTAEWLQPRSVGQG